MGTPSWRAPLPRPSAGAPAHSPTRARALRRLANRRAPPPGSTNRSAPAPRARAAPGSRRAGSGSGNGLTRPLRGPESRSCGVHVTAAVVEMPRRHVPRWQRPRGQAVGMACPPSWCSPTRSTPFRASIRALRRGHHAKRCGQRPLGPVRPVAKPTTPDVFTSHAAGALWTSLRAARP